MARSKQAPKKKKGKKNAALAARQTNEIELEKKKKQVLAAKARYRKLAGEFIDLWVKVRGTQRNASSFLNGK